MKQQQNEQEYKKEEEDDDDGKYTKGFLILSNPFIKK